MCEPDEKKRPKPSKLPQYILAETREEEPIGVITLNNSAKGNCLSEALMSELCDALQEMAERETRVVILRAPRGSKIWSSGFNIHELPDPGRDPLSYNTGLETTLRAIQHCPAPVIAMVEGSVWGGACDLVSICDIVVGTETATFAITPAKLGVPYTCSGLIHFINLIGVHVTKEMFFTGQPLEARRALELGIMNHLVPAGELESFTFDLARQILANSPLSVTVIKEQLRILSNAHPLSPETFERIQGLRRLVYDSEDYREGKRAFLEKRRPVFRGK